MYRLGGLKLAIQRSVAYGIRLFSRGGGVMPWGEGGKKSSGTSKGMKGG